jgi:hypothetical protein
MNYSWHNKENKVNYLSLMIIEKHIISLHKAQEKEYSLDKEQTFYDDLLDDFGLSLKGYNIE